MSLAGFRSRWASIPFGAFSVAIVFLTWQPAQAAALIRCPDWQRYVTPAAALRSTPPKQSFEAALATNLTRESRLAAKSRAKPKAGQGRSLASNRSASPRAARTESAASRTAGPLDAAGIFSRDGRRNSNKVNKRRAKSQVTVACPTHTVRKGDTLGKIAAAYLGNSQRWPELAKANSLTSPSRLRIGQTLRLPCAPDGQQPGHPLPRQGFLESPIGLEEHHMLEKSREGQAGADSTPRAPASVPVAVKPLPVWTARPGEFVSDVITRWAKRAGHTVVRDGVEEWKISVPVKIRGNFKHALDQLVVGFEGSGRPLAISLYANKVIRIGRPL